MKTLTTLLLLILGISRADAQPAPARVRPPVKNPTCETMPTVGRTIGELCTSGDTGILTYWNGAQWVPIGTAAGAGTPQLADIVVSDVDGTNSKAVVVQGGAVLLQDSDAGDVLQAAVDYLGTNGGLIWVKKGIYGVGTPVIVRNSNTGTLRVVGEGPKTIFKLTGPEPSLFRPTQVATESSETLSSNVWLEKFDLDANNKETCGAAFTLFGTKITTAAYTEPVDCPAIRAAAGTSFYQSYENITIRDINVYNVPQGEGTGTIGLSSRHYDVDNDGTSAEAIASPFETTQTNIWIDNVHIRGGDYGFILGDSSCCNQAASNRSDRIYVTNSSVIRTGVPSNWDAGALLYIGGLADVGNVLVDNFYGANSGDDCIEINQPDLAIVQNSTCKNSAIHNVVLRTDRNLGVAAGAKRTPPRYVVRNIHIINDEPIDFSYDPDGTGAVYDWAQDGIRGAGIITGCDRDNPPELCGSYDIDGYTFDLIKYTGTFPAGYGGHTTTGQSTVAFASFNYIKDISLKNVMINAETDHVTSDENIPLRGQGGNYGLYTMMYLGAQNGQYAATNPGTNPYEHWNIEDVTINWKADFTRDDTGVNVSLWGMNITPYDTDLHMKNIHVRIEHSGLGPTGEVKGFNLGNTSDWDEDGTALEAHDLTNSIQGTITNFIADLDGNATYRRGIYVTVPDGLKTKKLFMSGILGRNGTENLVGATPEALNGIFIDKNIMLAVSGGDGTIGDPYVGWTSFVEAGGYITFPCGYFEADGELDLADGTRIEGLGDCTVITSDDSGNHVIRALLADNVEIAKLKVDGERTTRTANYDVINFNASNHGLIDNVTIVNGPDNGIHIIGDGTNSTDMTIRDIRISAVEGQCVKLYNASKNLVDRVWCDVIGGGGTPAIQFTGDATNGGSDDNILRDSVVDCDGTDYGAYLGETYHTYNQIVGNRFIDCLYGVKDDGDNTIVRDNYFLNPGNYTILRNEGSDFTYSNNVSTSADAGIVIVDSDGRIRRGLITGNHITCDGAGYGIQLQSTDAAGMDEIALAGNAIECASGCITISAASNPSTLWTRGNLCIAGSVTSCPANWTCAQDSNP